MKKVRILIFGLLLVSCANTDKDAAVHADMLVKNEPFEQKLENISIEDLAVARLKNYFELVQLQTKHPEFKEDIEKQLNAFSTETYTKLEGATAFSVKNIRKAGDTAIFSDSLQTLKLYYDIVSKNATKTDSINALIATKRILLEGKETKFTKISFAHIKE